MPRVAVALTILPLLAACAATGSDKVHREVSAVVQDEGQRDKVIDAAQKGASVNAAMDKAAAGPTREKPAPQ